MNLTREQADAVKKAVRESIEECSRPEFLEKVARRVIDSLVKSETTGPEITVLTFGKDGKQGEYRFCGKPDFARIYGKTIGQGCMAAIVIGTDIGGHVGDDATVIWDRKIGKSVDDWRGWTDCSIPNCYGWHTKKIEVDKYINRVRTAISAWEEKQKPEFKEGEWYWCETLKEAVKLTEPVSNNDTKRWVWGLDGYTRSVPLSDLRPLTPEERKRVECPFKVGDYAYCTKRDSIVKIIPPQMTGARIAFEPIAKNAPGQEGWMTSEIPASDSDKWLRPLQDADWTREVGGLKVRAYEGNNGGIVLRTSVYNAPIIFNFEERGLAVEFCKAKNVPIMPLALSKGSFPKPV